MIASARFHKQIVRLLLDRGAVSPGFDVKPSGCPPPSPSPSKTGPFQTQPPKRPKPSTRSLEEAAEKGLLHEVELLLDWGGKINPRLGPNEKNALMLAAENGHEKVVQLLLIAVRT